MEKRTVAFRTKRGRRKSKGIASGIKQASLLMLTAGLLLGTAGCGLSHKSEMADGETPFPNESAAPEQGTPDGSAVADPGTAKEAGEEGLDAETERPAAERIGELLSSWDFDYGSIYLPEVQEALDEAGIRYAGFYNVSGERLDVTLEDGTALVFLETRDPDQNPAGLELMLKGDEFNKNGFQENYLNAYDVIWEDKFEPDLTEGLVEENELWGLNQTDLSIIRNQVYAVHGRKFSDPFLDAVFRQKRWYEPTLSAEEFDEQLQDLLSGTEQKNLQTVLKLESSMHYRKESGEDYDTARALLSGSWVDLDGDGAWERVFYETKTVEEEITEMTLRVSPAGEKEGTAETTLEEFRLHPHCYLSSMGGKSQLILAADGPSADYVMHFYGYEQGRLEELGQIYADVESLKVLPDRMSAPVECTHFQCQPLVMEFVLEDGAVRQVKKEFYEYRHTVATALAPIVLLAEKADDAAVINVEPGEQVRVIGGDLTDWVLLERVSTGEQGWLRVREQMCRLPDGTEGPSDLWFDGLPFYG